MNQQHEVLNNKLEHIEEEVHNNIAFEEMCGIIKSPQRKLDRTQQCKRKSSNSRTSMNNQTHWISQKQQNEASQQGIQEIHRHIQSKISARNHNNAVSKEALSHHNDALRRECQNLFKNERKSKYRRGSVRLNTMKMTNWKLKCMLSTISCGLNKL